MLHRYFKKNEAKLHIINYLFWECTQRCQLNCRHCGSDCKTDASNKDMPLDDFLNAIRPLSKKYKKDTITVILTGGEPTLRPDIAQCGLALRQAGFRWGIVTNGYQYTSEIHGLLLGAGMGSVTLSIDGLEDTHNWMRGNAQSFSCAMRALRLIVSSSRLNYDVVTCVNQRNINQLPELLSRLEAEKVKAWRLFTISPIGRAEHNNDMQLTSSQLRYLMDFIVEARKSKTIKVNFSCEAYLGDYELKARDSLFFCRAGINIGSVLIDGSISACPNIHRSFAQGNIYTDNFLDIWENRYQVMRNRSWTKKGICGQCKAYCNCNGGAFHLMNNKRNASSVCIYNKIYATTIN